MLLLAEFDVPPHDWADGPDDAVAAFHAETIAVGEHITHPVGLEGDIGRIWHIDADELFILLEVPDQITV